MSFSSILSSSTFSSSSFFSFSTSSFTSSSTSSILSLLLDLSIRLLNNLLLIT